MATVITPSSILTRTISTKRIEKDVMNLGDLRRFVADCVDIDDTTEVQLVDRLTLVVESVQAVPPIQLQLL